MSSPDTKARARLEYNETLRRDRFRAKYEAKLQLLLDAYERLIQGENLVHIDGGLTPHNLAVSLEAAVRAARTFYAASSDTEELYHVFRSIKVGRRGDDVLIYLDKNYRAKPVMRAETSAPAEITLTPGQSLGLGAGPAEAVAESPEPKPVDKNSPVC